MKLVDKVKQLDFIGKDSARDVYGNWRLNRQLIRYLFLFASIAIGSFVVSVFPARVIFPSPPSYMDSVLHFSAGICATLFFAAVLPARDDLLAVVVMILGILFEPTEWWFYWCNVADAPFLERVSMLLTGDIGLGQGKCTSEGFKRWISGDDTIKDMTLVALGSLLTLATIGRYG